MKKFVIASVLSVIVAASTAFGQGYVEFTGARSEADDSRDISLLTPQTDARIDVTFLWASSTVTNSPPSAIMATTSTNNLTGFSYPSAWADIQNASASGWTFATTNESQLQQATAANGSFLYNGGADFPVVGWSTDIASTLDWLPPRQAMPLLAGHPCSQITQLPLSFNQPQ